MKAWMLAVVMVACVGAGPATVPSTEQQLREIINGLRAQIAQLKAENAALRRKLATQPATRPAEKGMLRVGMTLEQANRAIGEPGKLVYKNARQENYEWEMWSKPGVPIPNMPPEAARPQRLKTIVGTFVDGRLAEFAEFD